MPDLYLDKTKWILNLIESGWNFSSATLHLYNEKAKEDISEYLVICAAKHSKSAIEALKNEFVIRWEKAPKLWWAGIQREVISVIAAHDEDYEWAKSQLERIELFMLHGLDLNSRVKECETQAIAWLRIGEKEHALSALYQLIKCARGIYSEKDYQLGRWAKWIRETNLRESTPSVLRIQRFIRQVFSVEDTASGVDDALLIILQIIFDISPHKSIQVYKNLLERKVIAHDEGIIRLLISTLEARNPPIFETYWIMEDLLFPFVRTKSPKLIKAFLAEAIASLGKENTLELLNRMVESIKTRVQENQRASWLNDVYDAAKELDIDPASLEIQYSDFDSKTASSDTGVDYRLYLETGEQLSLREAISVTSTVDGLKLLLKNEKKQSGNYFKWHKLASNLIEKVSAVEQINEICSLMEGHIDGYFEETYLVDVYVAASKRLYELGYDNLSKQYIQKGLELTKLSGWSTYWDGGVKHKAMQQLIKVMGPSAREEMIRLYVQDLSERHRYPEELIKSLDEIVQVLFDHVP